MDFMKLISSLDELLYEVISWLLFFPLTLWRTVTRPLGMMDYADDQLALPEVEQYTAALSPPLFLTLSLLLAHAAAVALGQTDVIVADKSGVGGLINDDASALVLRTVLFASFALFAAARLVRRKRLKLDRVSLRQPFYAQCYPVAVFALGLSVGVSLTQLSHPWARASGFLLIVTVTLYYVVSETRWFASRLAIGYFRAAGAMVLSLAESVALFLLVAFLLTR